MWETLKLIDAKIGTRELLDEVAIIKEVHTEILLRAFEADVDFSLLQ